MHSSEKTIFDKCSQYWPEWDEQCCAISNRICSSAFLIYWRFWSLYRKRKWHSRKMRWIVARGMPNLTDAVWQSEELPWNSSVTCLIVPSLVDGLPFPPLRSTLPDSVNACSHLRKLVPYGEEFYMTRRTNLFVSVTVLVWWYSEWIRAISWDVNGLAEFSRLRQSFAFEWETWIISRPERSL